MRRNSVRNLMCVGRYAEKMQWSEAKWNLFEMPAIDIPVWCIPAECDNIKLPIDGVIASRWDACLLCDICRHFALVMLHFALLISHNLRCIPAYTHQIPMGFFTITTIYMITPFLVWWKSGRNISRPPVNVVTYWILIIWCGRELSRPYHVKSFESAVFLQMGGLDAYYVFAFGEVGE